MMPPVCVQCRLVMKITKTGADVELMFGGDDSERGYQIWNADLFECPSCGAEIIAQFGQKPVAEHYHEKYAAFKAGVLVRFWDRAEDRVI